MQALIERCWSKEPKNRPTFREHFNKLSLSLENDDYTIESRLKDMISYAYEYEDFDYYQYCLENVETERVYDYVDEIPTAQPSKESSRDVKGGVPKSEFDAINRQNQQRIEELVEQNQKFQREIKELKKKHENEIKLLSGKNTENQREIGELKLKNEKQAAEISNLIGQVTINIPAFNDEVSNRIKVLEALIELINAKLEKFKSHHTPDKSSKSTPDSVPHKEINAKPTLFGTRPKSSVPPLPPPPPPGYKLKTKLRTYR